MADMLDAKNKHIFTEARQNTGNSFIANVNTLVGHLDEIVVTSQNITSVTACLEHIDDIVHASENIESIKDFNTHVDESLVRIDANVRHVDSVQQEVTDLRDETRAIYNSTIANNNELREYVDSTVSNVNNTLNSTVNNMNNKLNSTVDEITATADSLTNTVNKKVEYIESMQKDIEGAVADAAAEITCDDIIDEVADKAVPRLEALLTGDTDFVKSYNDKFNETVNSNLS